VLVYNKQMPDGSQIASAVSSDPTLNDEVSPATASGLGFLAGRFRWVICGLLFLGVTKNYMDRQVLGVLKGSLQHEFGWTEIDYGNIVFAFQAAYAAGMLCVGRLVDRVGTRAGYAMAMVFWSIASMAHAAVSSLAGFMAARCALGFGEAGVFPASIKCVAEWFPKKERAFATGIFNSGTSIGAIITPLVVPVITLHWGWRWAFIATGSLGFAWLALWFLLYRKPDEHPWCNETERNFIRQGQTPAPVRMKWLDLLPYRQTWTFALGKFLTDPIWWFYLFWIPDYLQRQHGLRLGQIGLPILVIYAISDAGSIAGGWLPTLFLRHNFSMNAARKLAMLASALCVVPIAMVYRISGLWPATLLIGLAAAGHQGFSANLFTLTSDLFPSRAVGSVVGIGGMSGAIGGMLIAEIVGHLLQWTGSYVVPFFIAASAYLVALSVIHLLSPRLAMVEIPKSQAS
jgi:MFS transporter, ACS family, hexuronate transporter